MATKKGNTVREISDLIHDAIATGATSVEEIHKSIAELPLEVLEEVEPLRKVAREVRQAQDRSISAVYRLIRKVNDQVQKLGADVLSEVSNVARKRQARKTKRPAAAKRRAVKR